MEELIKVPWSDWETVGLIGRGSFGTVYEIQRKLIDEDTESAALKVITIPQNPSDIDELYSEGYDDESITATFNSHLKSIVAEYSLMRKMDGSANVVNCKDIRYIQHDNGLGWDIFIRMELLTPLMKALPSDVSEDVVIKLAKDICSALVLCKKHEIVHRDIKPQNIFVSPNGDYKLGDFGIAKTVEKTMGGTKIGTYKYMAPEVYNNQPYGSAADIYSLGLVLYWLLNERRMPFLPLPPAKLGAGMDEDARYRRLSGEPLRAPAHGSRELKQLVLKACAYDPKDRFASAAEMLEAVNNLNGGTAVSADSAGANQGDDLTVGPIFNGRQKQDDSKADILNGNATVGPIFSNGNGPKPTAIPTAGIPYTASVPVSNRGAVVSNASRNSTPMHHVQVHTAGTNTDRTVYTQQPKYHNNQIAGQDLGQRPIPSYPYEQQVWQAQTQNSQKYTRSNREKTKRIYIFSGCAAAVLALVLLIAGVSGAFKSTDKPVPQNNTQVPSANVSEESGVHVHSWRAATCTTPKTCSTCGKTTGSIAAHSWAPATYTSPKTCRVCGTTDGLSLGSPLIECDVVEDSNDKNRDIITGTLTDMSGNKHTDAVMFWVSNKSGLINVEHIVYEIGNNYDVLNGVLTLSDKSDYGAFVRFYIYGDNKLLYKSGYISTTEQEVFQIDVSGINELRIECETDEVCNCYGLLASTLHME